MFNRAYEHALALQTMVNDLQGDVGSCCKKLEGFVDSIDAQAIRVYGFD